MTDDQRSTDAELIRSVWEEARDLVKRLEGEHRRPLRRPGRRHEDRDREGHGSGAGRGRAAARAAGAPAEERRGGGPDDRHAIVAPLVGTFYGAPQPGADPFVKVGDTVDAGQTVGIVEAMKLMNQVQADEPGRWRRSSSRTASGSSSSRRYRTCSTPREDE